MAAAFIQDPPPTLLSAAFVQQCHKLAEGAPESPPPVEDVIDDTVDTTTVMTPITEEGSEAEEADVKVIDMDRRAGGNINNLKVKELQALCKQKGLKSTGKRAELLARIQRPTATQSKEVKRHPKDEN